MDDRLDRLNHAFSPSAPIKAREMFRGRQAELEKVCDAINQPGQHFVLFGERGVGKTSLANVIATQLTNVVVSRVTCNRDENFRQLWAKALSRVTFTQKEGGIGFTATPRESTAQLDLFLPDTEDIDSVDVLSTLERVSANLLFVFDEFDSIAGSRVRTKFADTLKALSDNSTYVTIGLVGIGDNIEELVGRHPSVERCIKQIAMPRMSQDELRQIIDKGIALLGMTIDARVRASIAEFSSGFPHYCHLIALAAARACILDGGGHITESHYQRGLGQAIQDVDHSTRASYQRAVLVANSKSRFEGVLGACALSDVDEFGTFSARDLIEPYYRVAGQLITLQEVTYTLSRLCEGDRGKVISRVGTNRNVRFRFTSPFMRIYTLMVLGQKGTYSQPNLFV